MLRCKRISKREVWISNIRGGGVSGASKKGLDDVSSIQGIVKLFI